MWVPIQKVPLKLLTTGYVDDLGTGTGATIGRSTVQINQHVVNALNVWLAWSTMQAKPTKCVPMALTRGVYVKAKLTINVGSESFPMACIDDEAGETIKGAGLRGSQKVWIWDAYVMSMISWMLLIHDILPSWVKGKLSPIQIRWFSKWVGFPHKRHQQVNILPVKEASWTAAK